MSGTWDDEPRMEDAVKGWLESASEVEQLRGRVAELEASRDRLFTELRSEADALWLESKPDELPASADRSRLSLASRARALRWVVGRIAQIELDVASEQAAQGEAALQQWRDWFQSAGGSAWDQVDDVEAALGRYDEGAE